jgi:glycosyltransferase involved in cell wall biosynthesis
LESIKWADEIVIIDSFSTDNTLIIAKEFTDAIYQHEYINSAHQKNNAIQFCNNEWIFQIDSDETLEPGAEKTIRLAIENASNEIECFQIPRKNHVLGKWVKYGGLYPDWEYRLFRKNKGRWLEKEVHSRVVVKGKTILLDTPIIHYGMPNISKQVSNLDRYSRYEADELKKKNVQFSWIRWLISPPLIFFKKYIIQKGILDGWRGFFLAAYSAIYIFMSHAKLKEIELLDLHRSPQSD